MLTILASLTVFLIGCSEGYKKVDGKWAYVSYDEGVGKRVTYMDVDQATFETLDNKGYAKDKNNVFLTSGKIDNANPETFHVIGNGYAADNKNVYLDRETLIDAEPMTFEQLDFPYSRDNKNVFCGTLPLDISNLESFKVTKSSSSKSTVLTTHFIELNPEYSFIDSIRYKGIIYGYGTAKTDNEKFDGYKKIK